VVFFLEGRSLLDQGCVRKDKRRLSSGTSMTMCTLVIMCVLGRDEKESKVTRGLNGKGLNERQGVRERERIREREKENRRERESEKEEGRKGQQ